MPTRPLQVTADAHWLEIVDGQGLYPAKRLGPYATARLAGRAQRGVMRLLNARRYTVAVVSQQDLDGRDTAGTGQLPRGMAYVPVACATGSSSPSE